MDSELVTREVSRVRCDVKMTQDKIKNLESVIKEAKETIADSEDEIISLKRTLKRYNERLRKFCETVGSEGVE